LRFRTVKLPQIPKEKPSDPDFSYATFWAEGVWKRSKNAEVAWNFLKFMSSENSLQKLNELRNSNNLMEKAYPRPSMAIMQKDDKVLGSIVALAPAAKWWYLEDKTNDGATGINSQINDIFGSIVKLGNRPADIGKAVPSLSGKINTVLTKFNKKR
jgi:ABC-type glycerol-3-phosphate transport system substrate-binding protein